MRLDDDNDYHIRFFFYVWNFIMKFYNNTFEYSNIRCKEKCLDLLFRKNCKVRLTQNKQLEIVCLQVVTKDDDECVITNYEKMHEKYVSFSTLYLMCKSRLKNCKSTKELYKFLKEFGLSFHYKDWIKLYNGYKR